jgi:hypothetical protein
MLFSGSTSTKIAPRSLTYAQNLCCGAVRQGLQGIHRYQTHSEGKLLIHMTFLNCFFYRQSSESLDFKGLPAIGDNLSTKLSTEKVGSSKALVNQALSGIFACSFEEVSTIPHKFEVYR